MNLPSMHLFDKAKLKSNSVGFRKCYFCDIDFKADNRNVKRGWGNYCSKSCSAKMRAKINGLNNSERISILRDLKLKNILS